ncbi:MAG: uracil-DNA glycosylase [Thermacetogenium sp.]|nr:uracil-DNA glycosylase [Thermacetogenium sp.]
MDWLPQLDRCNTIQELQDVCLQCRRCGLRENSKRVVFGEGNENSRLMLVGEAPGAEEERLGRPFVGAAGKLLNKILAAAGFRREALYITNIAKCRPPGNRLPRKDEADSCYVYLVRQIELIKPRLIVCLGTLATQYLIHHQVKVSAVRGQVFEKGGIKIIATYHPAALLRDPGKKKPAWQDFQLIRNLYRECLEKNE